MFACVAVNVFVCLRMCLIVWVHASARTFVCVGVFVHVCLCVYVCGILCALGC